MTTTPFEPNVEANDAIPAADAGAGAPPPSEGYGVDGGDSADDTDAKHDTED